LSGGLGNQLFNYSAARSLSHRSGTHIVIDASNYMQQWGENSPRPLLLDHFPIKAQFRHLGTVLDSRNFLTRIWRRLTEEVHVERVERINGSYNYFSEFNDLGGRVKMGGYFISPKFFSNIEHLIRRELTLPSNYLEIQNCTTGLKYLDEMSRCRWTVGLHIRRGDYLTYSDPPLHLAGVEQYYLDAMNYITQKRDDPIFWVVSNETEWCKKYFSETPHDVRFIESEINLRETAIRDFFLLSRCHDQIICNSTFSWWAAWLNQQPDKIVISPSKWDAQERTSIEEMIPKSWTVLRV